MYALAAIYLHFMRERNHQHDRQNHHDDDGHKVSVKITVEGAQLQDQGLRIKKTQMLTVSV